MEQSGRTPNGFNLHKKLFRSDYVWVFVHTLTCHIRLLYIRSVDTVHGNVMVWFWLCAIAAATASQHISIFLLPFILIIRMIIVIMLNEIFRWCAGACALFRVTLYFRIYMHFHGTDRHRMERQRQKENREKRPSNSSLDCCTMYALVYGSVSSSVRLYIKCVYMILATTIEISRRFGCRK